jgi:hypothetical protein
MLHISRRTQESTCKEGLRSLLAQDISAASQSSSEDGLVSDWSSRESSVDSVPPASFQSGDTDYLGGRSTASSKSFLFERLAGSDGGNPANAHKNLNAKQEPVIERPTTFEPDHVNDEAARSVVRPMSENCEFRGVSLVVPTGCVVEECSEKQLVLAGPYNEEIFLELEKGFEQGGLPVVVEHWGGRYRVRMPSGLPSEKNVVDQALLLWKQRNPTERAGAMAFSSSATFGSVASAGNPRRFAPDSSVAKSVKYFEEVAKDYPTRILAPGFLPETVVEVRSPGNPRGELEKKAASMLALEVQEFFLIDGIECLTKSYRRLGVNETEADAKLDAGPDQVVTIEPLGDLLQPDDKPALKDVSHIKIVTLVDKNPTLLKSHVWPHLHFPITPLKTDPLYWRATARLFQITKEGLAQPYNFQVRVVLFFGPMLGPRLRL